MTDGPVARVPTAEELGHREALIGVLAEEVDRQLESVAFRASSMSSRASILVGSASILTGLQLPLEARPWTYAVALAAAALAAIAGAVALLPRRSTEVPVLGAEREFWNFSGAQSRWTLAHWKLDTLKEQENALKWLAAVIFVGFAFLAVALIFTTSSLIQQ